MDEVVIKSISVAFLCWLTLEAFYWLPKKLERIESNPELVVEPRQLQALRRRFDAGKKFKWMFLVVLAVGVVSLISSIVNLIWQ